MKKYALLSMIVLGISSTAFGICRVNVAVTGPVTCEDTHLPLWGRLCCTGDWNLSGISVERRGNQICVDLYLDCTSLTGCKCEEGEENLPIPTADPHHLDCGLYVLVVRVWVNYQGCACYPYSCLSQPLLRGMTMTSFKVCCDECGSYPCCCGLPWLCCLR